MVHETNWKNDVVYFYQFPRPPFVPNYSPFCLKVETFLRAFNIQYEIRESLTRKSEAGLVPFIELNGQHIADSQTILDKLTEHFKLETNNDPRSKALLRALASHVDNVMYPVLTKCKIDNVKEFSQLMMKTMRGESVLNTPLAAALGMKMKSSMSNKITSVFGKIGDAELNRRLRCDLDTLRDTLGNEEFFNGSNFSAVDASVFSQLAVVYYIPLDLVPKQLLDSDYPTLVSFLERVRSKCYPDDFVQNK